MIPVTVTSIRMNTSSYWIFGKSGGFYLMTDMYQRKNDCNNCGKPDCSEGYMTPIGFRLFCSPLCGNNYLGYPEDFNLELEPKTAYFFESESISEEDIYEIGSKVRSYDFVLGDKILHDDSYMEGYIVDFAPVPSCSPNCNHYHIDTTRIVRSGKEILPDDDGWSDVFNTHWDNYGVILLEEPYEEDYMTSDWIKRKWKKAEEDKLSERKERARKMEEESQFGKKLRRLRETDELSTNYYDEEKPTTFEDYPIDEPTGIIGKERREENWPPTSGMHWYDEIGEQMTFWKVPAWKNACMQCGQKSTYLFQISNGNDTVTLCGDCLNEQELLWWAITGVKPKGRSNPLTEKLLAESYRPPQSAINNAKKGLAQRKKWGRGGLSPAEAKSHGIDSGVTRARKIASGKVSKHDVKRMSAFNRHRKNNRPSKKMPDGGPTAGTIAWNLWGGSTGVNWAKKKSKTLAAEEV